MPQDAQHTQCERGISEDKWIRLIKLTVGRNTTKTVTRARRNHLSQTVSVALSLTSYYKHSIQYISILYMYMYTCVNARSARVDAMTMTVIRHNCYFTNQCSLTVQQISLQCFI